MITTFEVEARCNDCGAPLQDAPAWKESPSQQVYRCPWTTLTHFRVDHEDKELLIYNCNWPKGAVARRLSPLVR